MGEVMLAAAPAVRELEDWREDAGLLALLREGIALQREAAAAYYETEYRPYPGAGEAVSEQALDALLAAGRDVHGISRQPEISNVISFEASRLPDSAAARELARVRARIDRRVAEKVRAALGGGEWKVIPSGHFWYPPGGYMGWHTNSGAPGWRLYVTHAEVPGASFFRYRTPDTREIVTCVDHEWDARMFLISADRPLWHTIHSDTHRFSLGYKIQPMPRWWGVVRRLREAGAPL